MLTRSASAIGRVLAALTLTLTLSEAQDGGWRWRFFEDGSDLSLYIAQTDGGTDNIASPSFGCKRGTGRVHVRGQMDDAVRRALADLLRKDGDPIVEFESRAHSETTLLEPAYSGLDGWIYSFSAEINQQAFASLRSTGMFRFKLGDVWIEQGNKAGPGANR